MKSKSITIGVFLSVALIAIAAGLYWMANSIRQGNYQLAISLIRQISQIESQWSIETARVRADSMADFDGLITFIPRMERLKDGLLETMLGIPDLPEKLGNDLNAYLSALDAKEERIERFKMGYAVLRNSLRYLPLAAASVMQQVQEEGGEPAFVRNISSVTDEINTYLATPAPPEKKRLRRALEELGDSIVARHPDIAKTIANFVAHGQVLLDKREPTEETFQEATSSRVSDLGESLINDLESQRIKKETLASYYERGILGAGGALWVMWLAIALQIPGSRRRDAERVAAAPDAGVTAASPANVPVLLQQTNVEKDAGQEEESASVPPSDVPAQHSEGAKELVKLTADLLQAEEQASGKSPAPATETALHGVGLEVVAKLLTTVAERINSSMDILGDMQKKLLTAITPMPGAGDERERTEEEFESAEPQTAAEEEIKTAAAVVSSIRAQTEDIVALANRLPAFSEKHEEAYTLIDLNGPIREIVDSTGAETQALVVKELNPIPEMLALGSEIYLLLTNVIENAVWAVQEKGKKTGVIRLETREEGEEILVTITDNGIGIAPENRKKVFNPFYTSREDAMGMGLTLAQYLAQKYGGSIAVNSLPGQGTMVRITLSTGTESGFDRPE